MKRNKLLFLILFFGQIVFGQLNNFTLQVTPTNETCTGNGSLNFLVANTTTGATMSYAIFLLPNVTTPLATVTVNNLTGLSAGDYLVIATQSLGGNSATKQQNAVIDNEIEPLTYTLNAINVKCGNDGQIIVNVTNGTAAEYQILNGPVTTPYQTSNVFSNLPIGIYAIRVKDSCGDAVVQTFTLVQDIVNLNIGAVSYSDGALPACNTINIMHNFGVGINEVIAYPLSFTLTVMPPGGGMPIVFNQTITSAFQISHVIPFYHDQSYQVLIQAIDACGNIYNRNDSINQKFNFLATVSSMNCTDLVLSIEPKFYVAPYTVTFLNFPVGFNPVNFNTNHPGPFTQDMIFYGSGGNSFPEGDYTMQLTDACGRTMIKDVTALLTEPTVTALEFNDGCGGGIFILISGAQMITVNVIDAPPSYAFPLPHNISNLIDPDGLSLSLNGIPEGSYTFEIIDSCGNTHVISQTVTTPSMPIITFQWQACEVGYGSIGVYTVGNFTSVTLIDAPADYTGTLPENLNGNILGSGFLFGPVPEGDYTFQFTNNCGGSLTVTIFIEGYQITTNNFIVTPRCGSFDLFVEHNSNSNFNVNFWLQKFNPSTGQWQHPATNDVYVPGTPLTTNNAIFLVNNTNNLNLAFTGQFRVMKNFTSLQNTTEINCIEEVYNFTFSGGPQIINVTSILCTNTTNQVIVEAIGIPPLTYGITSKNGVPFIVNNGTSNTFINLEPAIYNFQVTDVCGNIVNSIFDITALDPLSITASNFCDGENGFLSVTSFPFLSYEWRKATDPSTILSTSSLLEFLPYNSTSDFGQYFVRITNIDTSTACVGAILNFEIPETPSNPQAGIGQTINYCGSRGTINLFSLLTGTFDLNGVWNEITSSGSLSGSTWDSSTVVADTYQFRYTVTGSCGFTNEAIVTIVIKDIPIAAFASGIL